MPNLVTLRTRRRSEKRARLEEDSDAESRGRAEADEEAEAQDDEEDDDDDEEADEDEEDEDDEEEEAVPTRRSRTRSRRARASSGESDTVYDGDTVEIDGRDYRIENDALVLPIDEAGERKIDAQGRLLGGRSYRVSPFTLPMRDDPERLYMLSIDVARASGFRDSAYFFRKNPLLHKIVLTFEEKDHLIATGRISGQLRARNVTMIAARSVFQQLGARIVLRGRHVTDDYYEHEARSEGKREGALISVPSIEDILRAERRRDADRDRGRRKDAATYRTVDPQGETVITTFGDSGQSPFERAAQWIQRRAALQRANITEENWMAEIARSVQTLNSELAEARRERLVAFSSASNAAPQPIAAPSDESEFLDFDDRAPWAKPPHAAEALRRARARARRQAAAREPPVGLYEPHTHTAHVSTDTQPTRSFCSRVDTVPHGVPPAKNLYTVEMGIGTWSSTT
ncbi:chromatin structure-remodeling complex subunit RSC7 [Malassezia cuniculi]|uniref:Chromatin structure-remodeling complex subunit RSC7 n=1 Tax=Malassezia cuniculi TaxID=948313 RepID=A0AAF0EXP6_9BASI|nr:chromatin structure-remodeling complex subunit RSC7 [Malassezia cuniculi]